MNKRMIFVTALIFVFSFFVFGQTKTITNKDLEKFRQKRLQAEKDFRENYAEMGFDSPEEIEEYFDEKEKRLTELSDKLRTERIKRENERIETFYYRVPTNDRYKSNGFINYNRFYSPSLIYGYGRDHRRDRRHRPYRDFRDRFINGLPNFVLQTHRFNTFNTGTRFKPIFPINKGKRGRQ